MWGGVEEAGSAGGDVRGCVMWEIGSWGPGGVARRWLPALVQ